MTSTVPNVEPGIGGTFPKRSSKIDMLKVSNDALDIFILLIIALMRKESCKNDMIKPQCKQKKQQVLTLTTFLN